MKRIIGGLLCLGCIVGFTGCGKKDGSGSTNGTKTTENTKTEESKKDISKLFKTYVEKEWNSVNETWEDCYKIEWNYDENYNMISRTAYELYQGSWEGNYKYEYTYDSKNRLTGLKDYYWSSTENNWVIDYRREITYDDNYAYCLHYEYYEDKQEWDEIPEKYRWVFDENQDIVEEMYYDYDDVTNTFILEEGRKSINTFDKNRLCTSQERWKLDTVDNKWYATRKELFEYDGFIETGSKIYKEKSGTHELELTDQSKTEVTKEDNKKIFVYKEWDKDTDTWHDENYKIECVEAENGFPAIVTSYNYVNNEWKKDIQGVYTYLSK